MPCSSIPLGTSLGTPGGGWGLVLITPCHPCAQTRLTEGWRGAQCCSREMPGEAWVLRTGPARDGRDHLPLKSTLHPPKLALLAWFAMPARPCLSGDGGCVREEHGATIPAQPATGSRSSQPAGRLMEWLHLQLVKRPMVFAARPRPAPNECHGALRVNEEVMRHGGSPGEMPGGCAGAHNSCG